MLNYEEYYMWYKAIHVIAVISWMAGLLYLPRICAYHTRAQIGSEMDKTFQIMEKKLLKIIMNPAMIATIIFGALNAQIYGWKALGVWFHIKMTAVLLLVIFHHLEAKWVKAFAKGENKHTEKFFRMVNEIPAILMIIAVIMVIVKPFE